MLKIIQIKRPSTLKNLVYKEIKDLLLSGRFESEKIYSASHFAEILSVSRTPVREALLQLVAEGFLVPVQGLGFKIKELFEKEIKDFFETRRLIEAYVIEHLVEKITEQDIQQLESILKRVADRGTKGDLYGFMEADKDFHMNLMNRYNNLLLKSIMENIRSLIAPIGQKAALREGAIPEVIKEHENILQALRRKDKKKAVQAALNHLNNTEKSCLAALKQ